MAGGEQSKVGEWKETKKKKKKKTWVDRGGCGVDAGRTYLGGMSEIE